jgi:4-hydroxybenzoate polyprenyltransferase
VGTLLILLGVVFSLVGVGCSIFILISAFQDEIWKGILYLVCGLYGIYYALVEFDHEKKWLILAGAFLGSMLGWGLIMAGGAASGHPVSP